MWLVWHPPGQGWGFVDVAVIILVLLPFAAILTLIHLKLTDYRIRRKMDERIKDPGRVERIFRMIEKRNQKRKLRKEKEKEEILRKFNLKDDSMKQGQGLGG
jgi:predicted Holliday junction resolvase-like endonuclease